MLIYERNKQTTKQNKQTNKQTNIMSDPLGKFKISLTDAKTDMPRLKKGNYTFIIKSAEVKMKKDSETDRNLVVSFATSTDSVGLNGEKLSSGFPVTNYYPLQQSENPKAPDFKRDIVFLIAAAFKASVAEAKAMELDEKLVKSLAGNKVQAFVDVQDSEKYGPSNRISKLKSA